MHRLGGCGRRRGGLEDGWYRLGDLPGADPEEYGMHEVARPDPERRVGSGFMVLYTLAYIGTCLVLIAPITVTLALKINSLVGTERAPGSLALVVGVGAVMAMVGTRSSAD